MHVHLKHYINIHGILLVINVKHVKVPIIQLQIQLVMKLIQQKTLYLV